MAGEKLCRTCAKKETLSTLLTFLFSKEADELDLRGKLQKYTPVVVNEDDDTPKSICSDCKKIIIDWHLFWENCVKIDNYFKLNLINSISTEKTTLDTQQATIISSDNVESAERDIIVKRKSDNLKILEDVTPKKKPRGIYCIAKWCNNNNGTSKLFRFPKDDRCHVWLSRAGRDDLSDLNSKQLNNRYLCKDHFTDDMFMNDSKNSLRWNALPTLFKSRNAMPSSSKDSNDVLQTSIYGKYKRPLMIKPQNLLRIFSDSQPITMPSTDLPNIINMVQVLKPEPQHSILLPNKQQYDEKAGHIVILNTNEERKSCEMTGIYQTSIIKPKSYENILQEHKVENEEVQNIPLAVKKQSITKSGVCNTVIKSFKVIGQNNSLNLTRSDNEIETLKDADISPDKNEIVKDDCQVKNLNALISSKKNTLSEDVNQDNVGKMEEIHSVVKNPSKSINSIVKTAVSNKSKLLSKNLNPVNIVAVDPIENFKDSDVDSLCSGQGFRECMYPCLACGEVFLMKSSLAQHCKTYHGENFDDVNN